MERALDGAARGRSCRLNVKQSRLSASIVNYYIYNTMSFPEIQYAHWLKISCLSTAEERTTKNEVISLRSWGSVLPSKRNQSKWKHFFGPRCPLRASSAQIWMSNMYEKGFFLALAKSWSTDTTYRCCVLHWWRNISTFSDILLFILVLPLTFGCREEAIILFPGQMLCERNE